MSAIKDTRGDKVFTAIVYVLVAFVFLIVLYPLIYVLSSSISNPSAVASGEVWLLPKGISFAGYRRVFQDRDIITGYLNSIYYTVVGTLLDLVVTVPAGYALSHKDLPGRKIFTGIFMFIMYFSGGLIPCFLLVKSIGLYNTRAIIIILGAFSTYNCIICQTFFGAMPPEMEEAASIDGCSPSRCFVQIILPLSKALLGVMVLYFAVSHWNSYFQAMIYETGTERMPLQVILRRILVLEETTAAMNEMGADEFLADQYNVQQLIKYSVIVVSSLPVLVLYPFLQKYFDKGVMIGSVKG